MPDHPAYAAAGFDEWGQVGLPVAVDRGGDGDDVYVAVAQSVEVCRASHPATQGCGYGVAAYFQSVVGAAVEPADPQGIDVIAHHLMTRREKTSQRKPDIAESDDTYFISLGLQKAVGFVTRLQM